MLILTDSIIQATNFDETFAKPISCMRLLILVLLVVPLICLSEEAIEKFRGESMVLIEIELPKYVVSVARRALVDFLVGSVVVPGYGGVVFLSCILEEGSLFSQPGEDYPSHDEGSVSLSFLSAILNFMPLPCLGFEFLFSLC